MSRRQYPNLLVPPPSNPPASLARQCPDSHTQQGWHEARQCMGSHAQEQLRLSRSCPHSASLPGGTAASAPAAYPPSDPTLLCRQGLPNVSRLRHRNPAPSRLQARPPPAGASTAAGCPCRLVSQVRSSACSEPSAQGSCCTSPASRSPPPPTSFPAPFGRQRRVRPQLIHPCVQHLRQWRDGRAVDGSITSARQLATHLTQPPHLPSPHHPPSPAPA